ncbi:hypothetical protein V9T40_011724 [Parthenolecanium corni]|uniref:Uncharacterized protein n=1 Tax=Parthenolecanium corni TaxID=536013 RepID=A0AAN9T9U9_9HEMI
MRCDSRVNYRLRRADIGAVARTVGGIRFGYPAPPIYSSTRTRERLDDATQRDATRHSNIVLSRSLPKGLEKLLHFSSSPSHSISITRPFNYATFSLEPFPPPPPPLLSAHSPLPHSTPRRAVIVAAFDTIDTLDDKSGSLLGSF